MPGRGVDGHVEVREARAAKGVDKDVGWLDVGVDDAVRVQVLERQQNLRERSAMAI